MEQKALLVPGSKSLRFWQEELEVTLVSAPSQPPPKYLQERREVCQLPTPHPISARWMGLVL